MILGGSLDFIDKQKSFVFIFNLNPSSLHLTATPHGLKEHSILVARNWIDMNRCVNYLYVDLLSSENM